MKHLDLFSKRILVICTSCCALLLFASLFVFSIKYNTATASETINTYPNVPVQAAGNGHYMMSYQAFVYSDGSTGYNVLVWDTESGKSRIYYYKKGDGKMVHWTGGDLPSNPLN